MSLIFEMFGSFGRRYSSCSIHSQEESRISWLENDPGRVLNRLMHGPSTLCFSYLPRPSL